MCTLDSQVQKEDGGTEAGIMKIFIVSLSVSVLYRDKEWLALRLTDLFLQR
jgi:hypothetical protein